MILSELPPMDIAPPERGPNKRRSKRIIARQNEIDLCIGVLHAITPRGNPMTLEAIGAACGLTGERIRQIEQRAMRKLRIRIYNETGLDWAEFMRKGMRAYDI